MMDLSSLTPWLPAWLSPEQMLIMLAGAEAFAAVLIVWYATLARNPMTGRARALVQRQKALQAGLRAPRRRADRRKVEAVGLMRRLVDKLNLLRSREAERIAAKLAHAGWRSKDSLVIYMFFKISLPFAFGGVAIFLLYAVQIVELEAMPRLAAALAAVVAGAYAPEVFVKNAVERRRQALLKGLPDALDLLVICAEAGLSLDAALKRVSHEMARSAPEIADEFGLTSVELGFLPDRKQALINLNDRTNSPSIRGVVSTLMQTERYGTPLAQSLRVLAGEFRTERLLRAEAKAAKLPATLTVPMIIFILPTLFIVLLGPAVLRAIDSLTGTTF